MAKHETNDHAMKTMCEQQQPGIHPSSLLSVRFVCIALAAAAATAFTTYPHHACLQQPKATSQQNLTRVTQHNDVN